MSQQPPPQQRPGFPAVPVGTGGPLPGMKFNSNRGKTLGLVIGGVVVVGLLGGVGAAIAHGNEGDPHSYSSEADDLSDDAAEGPNSQILNPTPVATATSQPTDDSAPEPTSAPTSEAPPQGSIGEVVEIGDGVQIPVPQGWEVFLLNESRVALHNGEGSYVDAIVGAVAPSADAVAVLGQNRDIFLDEHYSQVQRSDIVPHNVRGAMVSFASFDYVATWTDPQAAIQVQGHTWGAVRQDGTALLLNIEHGPPEEFRARLNSFAPIVGGAFDLFAGT